MLTVELLSLKLVQNIHKKCATAFNVSLNLWRFRARFAVQASVRRYFYSVVFVLSFACFAIESSHTMRRIRAVPSLKRRNAQHALALEYRSRVFHNCSVPYNSENCLFACDIQRLFSLFIVCSRTSRCNVKTCYL